METDEESLLCNEPMWSDDEGDGAHYTAVRSAKSTWTDMQTKAENIWPTRTEDVPGRFLRFILAVAKEDKKFLQVCDRLAPLSTTEPISDTESYFLN